MEFLESLNLLSSNLSALFELSESESVTTTQAVEESCDSVYTSTF